MIPKKTFGSHIIKNFSDLIGNSNWSASYYTNKEKGLVPYIKQGGIFIPIEPKKSIPKNAIYSTPENVKKYNELADKIKELQAQQEVIIPK